MQKAASDEKRIPKVFIIVIFKIVLNVYFQLCLALYQARANTVSNW